MSFENSFVFGIFALSAIGVGVGVKRQIVLASLSLILSFSFVVALLLRNFLLKL